MLTLVRIIALFGNVLTTALVVRAILSWFTRGYGNGPLQTIYGFLYRLTEPLVEPVRNFMNARFNTGMIDFSLVVTMILIEVVVGIVVRLLLLFA